MKRAKPKRSTGCSRLLLCVVAAILGIVYWTVVGSLLQHHSSYHRPDDNNSISHNNPKAKPPPPSKLNLSRFEAPSTGGVLRSTRTEKPLPPPPQDGCAINLYGLPRSFQHHVLPSLIRNVIKVNEKYRCDYFVHFFNVTAEQSDGHGEASRGGNAGGAIHAQDIYLLKDYLQKQDAAASKGITNSSQPAPIQVEIVADTDAEFAKARKDAIDEIVHGTNGDQSINPYFVQEASFTETTLVNILKMWHSQDRVWNLMERSEKRHRHEKRKAGNTKLHIHYKRVAMLRLDVVYTTPIDIYKVPKDRIPADYNDRYLKKLRNVRGRKPQKYFFDYHDATEDYNDSLQHCVLPGFKSYPVNDRFFVGPYRAVKIWAKDRFSRAREHVQTVLPALEAKRLESMDAAAREKEAQAKSWGGVVKLTDYGLHDERFVAHSLLPAIRELTPTTELHVDRDLYFVRVRADGAMWLKDKPGFGRVSKQVLEEALGRECTGDVYEVLDPVLGDKGPGRWQIKCPPVLTDDDGNDMEN